MVPGAGIEPARLAAGDFESGFTRYADISQGTMQCSQPGSPEGAVALIIPWPSTEFDLLDFCLAPSWLLRSGRKPKEIRWPKSSLPRLF